MKSAFYLAVILCVQASVIASQSAVARNTADGTFQGEITITKVGGQKVDSPATSPGAIADAQRPSSTSLPPPGAGSVSVLSLAPVIEVRGEVTGLERKDSGVYLVQAVVQRLYDGSWWVAGRSGLAPPNKKPGRADWGWAVRDVHLPLPDYGKDFKIMAVLLREDRALPEGLVDYGSLQHNATALTDVVRGRILKCGGQVEITQIRDVSGKLLRLTPEDKVLPEVGWTAEVRGVADRPPDADVYLVIQPIVSEEKWVMRRKGTLAGRNWSETGYFGEEGLHVGELFRLQAVVSREPLTHGKYTPEEWHGFEGGICAASEELLVRRRIGPGDLVIKSINDETVAGKTEIQTEMECQVAGSIEDPQPVNALLPSETVWVLFRRVDGDEGWTVGALALTSADGLAWRVPSIKFPHAGLYKLIAVAAQGTELPRKQLSDSDWYIFANRRSLKRLSRMVTVNAGAVAAPAGAATQTEPPNRPYLTIALASVAFLLLLLSLLYVVRRARRASRGALGDAAG